MSELVSQSLYSAGLGSYMDVC